MRKVGWSTFWKVFLENIYQILETKLTSFFKIIIYQFTKFNSKELYELIISREKLKEEYFEMSPKKHLMPKKKYYLALLQLTLN